jgi:two-component system chemotaxis response regulator CheB
MPQNAIANANVDFILPLRDISKKLLELVRKPVPASILPSGQALMDMENKISELDSKTFQMDDRPGIPSAFSCPDCGGVLWEIDDGQSVRFRCRVGHAFSPDSLLAAQNDVMEQALWSALKTLEERLASGERQRGHKWMAARFGERERDGRERAESIRKFLISSSSEVPQAVPEEMQNVGGR